VKVRVLISNVTFSSEGTSVFVVDDCIIECKILDCNERWFMCFDKIRYTIIYYLLFIYYYYYFRNIIHVTSLISSLYYYFFISNIQSYVLLFPSLISLLCKTSAKCPTCRTLIFNSPAIYYQRFIKKILQKSTILWLYHWC
jgi:hypothetical protein